MDLLVTDGSIPARRPSSVSLVVFFTVLGSVLDIIGGVVLLALGRIGSFDTALRTSAGVVTAVAVTSIVIGLITVFVGLRLRSGAPGARMVVTAIEVLQIVVAIISVATVGFGPGSGAQVVGTVAMALIVLGLLWNARANAFFANPAVSSTRRAAHSC